MSGNGSSDRERRAVAVLDEYLAARRAGRSVSRSEIIARHPDLAPDLEECLKSLDLIAGTERDADSAIIGGTLGDFRILREIGRGGMGVVYEATQLSLGRRVALKVLPFAAVFDERHLQRFRNEAQAAAFLHHTNIVPVHAVGCERGVHYYAMQYIEGRSFAQILDELRAPGAKQPSSAPLSTITKDRSTQTAGYCRAVARLAVQAAEALDHAHERGVVHRDIKPGNLMLDAHGHIWITDFGLASFERNPGLTMTGDLLGTVRYMSPEQALGNRVPADHRTDVYSLGATLYEILTLEPTFAGEEPHQVMRDIASEDPVPLRRHNRAVPQELETIVLKALEKDPAARYGTAGEMARDLERFLLDRPIVARPPTLLDRTLKLARRHKKAVVVAVVALLLAAASLALSTALIARERDRAEDALVAAVRRFDKAVAAVDAMLLETGADALDDAPGLTEVRERLLERALDFYRQLLDEEGDRPELRLGQARVHRRLVEILSLLGRPDDAMEVAEAAVVQLDALQADPEVRRERALVYAALASLWLAQGDRPRSRESLLKAKQDWQDLPRSVEVEDALASIRAREAWLNHLDGREEDAIASLREAVALQERIADRAPAYAVNLAAMLRDLAQILGRKDHVLAEPLFLRARDVLRSTEGEQRYRIACLLHDLASMLAGYGRFEDSLPHFAEAIDLARALARDFPTVPEYQALLGKLRNRCGTTLGSAGRWDEAITELENAAGVYEQLTARYPEPPQHMYGWAATHINRGLAVWKRDGLEAALPALREAERIGLLLCERDDLPPESREEHIARQVAPGLWSPVARGVPDYRQPRDLARMYQRVFLQELGRWDEVELVARRHADQARTSRHPELDIGSLVVLAHLLSVFPRADTDEALAILAEAARLRDRTASDSDRIEVASDAFECETLGMALYRAGRLEEAHTALERALTAGQRRIALVFLAMSEWRLGDAERARRSYAAALAVPEEHDQWENAFKQVRQEAAALLGLGDCPSGGELR